MGRTIQSWRMVAADETRRLRGFREMLRSDDKVIFDDLMRQCKLYASHASTMTSVVKEIPLIMSMLFGQHKRLMELEKQLNHRADSE
ncbi:MAG: hypothetical protein ACLPY5_14155 [Candidatus Bathyarchaeia archaeon]